MKIGVIQLCSLLDPLDNLKKVAAFVEEAAAKKVEAIFLPECFYSMGDGTAATPYLVDPVKKNEHYQNIQNLALKFGIYFLGGSATTKIDDKIVNRAYNFDKDGNDLGHYDKIHLFSCDLSGVEDKKVVREADVYCAGSQEKVVDAGDLRVGLSICFDLRFPDLFREYRNLGANLISISSAFTVPSGKAHWHTLVRARAIENQLFIVAAAQWGEHNTKVRTYGHSLIVDPWGEVLADAGSGEKLITADIDLARINSVRKSIKMD